MSDFLATMAESSALRARLVTERAGVTGLRSQAASAEPALPLTIDPDGFGLIAEAKLASPAEGALVGDARVETVTDLARAFAGAGATAISVLTEPSRFAGSLEHLAAVAGLVDAPVLRKDFLVDPIQVIEARAAGASGVLLIARLCSPQLLAEMTHTAGDLGMFVLVEIFEESDLEVASAVFDCEILLGVNARDLTTLRVDPDRLATLAPALPTHLPTVAESGIRSPGDAARAARLGYRLALVGTGLVTSGDPAAAARRILEAARAALVGVL